MKASSGTDRQPLGVLTMCDGTTITFYDKAQLLAFCLGFCKLELASAKASRARKNENMN